MLKIKKLRRVYLLTAVVIALVLGMITLSGCLGANGSVAGGWSGGIVKDNVLYVGSLTGELAAVNTDSGMLVQTPVPLEKPADSSGFLGGCAQGATSVLLYGNPVIADNLVIIGGQNGKIYAFPRDEQREEARWVYPRQDSDVDGSIIGSVVFDNGYLYYGTTTNTVMCLEAEDGFKVWEIALSDMIWSTPAVSGDTVFIGCFDKTLYALDADDGTQKWTYVTEGAIVSTPVVNGSTVFVGSFDRNMYAIDAATGTMKWKFMADNWFWAKPVVYGNSLYAPCLDGKVYVLDIVTGTKKVEYNLNSPVSSSPVIVNGGIIVATQDGKIHRIDDGQAESRVLNVVEKEEKIFADLTAGDGVVYVHTSLNTLYEIDAKDGAKKTITIVVETEEDK